MVTISDFYRTDWFSFRTHYCFYSLALFYGFLFIQSIRVNEAFEAPALVSIKELKLKGMLHGYHW